MVASVAPFYRQGGPRVSSGSQRPPSQWDFTASSQSRGFGRGRGNGTFRGPGGIWTITDIGNIEVVEAECEQATHHSGHDELQSSHLSDMFLSPVTSASLSVVSKKDLARFIKIKNLPKTRAQDALDICSFIAELLNVKVERISYIKPSEKWDSLSALVLFPQTNAPHYNGMVIGKLHGQVFRDHHLLVSTCHSYEVAEPWCVKVSNLSTAVTEEALWRLFEPCGKLGMIFLNGVKTGSELEAIVNFEDFESVDRALKLDGTSLLKSNIKVMKLNPELKVKISPAVNLESMLEECNVLHIDKAWRGKLGELAYVCFSDQESYSKALNLNGQEWNGERLIVEPYGFKIFHKNPNENPHSQIEKEALRLIFGTTPRAYPRKQDLILYHILETKSEFDKALRSSPVLVKGQLVYVSDCISKFPSNDEEVLVKGTDTECDRLDDTKKVEDNDHLHQNISEDAGKVIPKSPEGIKKLQKPSSSNTDLKRKRNSSKVSKGAIKKGKA